MRVNTKNGKSSRAENCNKKPLLLEFLQTHKLDHPTADKIYSSMRELYPRISLGTVYRNLNALAREGKILKIENPFSPSRFDFRTIPHLHIFCKKCGSIFDISQEVSKYIIKYLPQGFALDDLQICASGLCPSCSSKINNSSTKQTTKGKRHGNTKRNKN